MELESDVRANASTSASLGPDDNDVYALGEAPDGPATATLSTASSGQLESVEVPDHTNPENGDLQKDGRDDGGEGEGESDIEDEADSDGNEADYNDVDMLLFDEFEPNPHELHRNNSMKEPMVPYGRIDPEQALQHFVQIFEERYGNRHPHFFIGALEDAMKEVVINLEDPNKLKPLLIFIHSDRSILAHVFCSEVLCCDAVVDFLDGNYITWPWDITSRENKGILLDMVEECFSKESQDDDESDGDKQREEELAHPWLERTFQHQYRYKQQARGTLHVGEHLPPRAVVEKLLANVDDLPVCLIFYPMSGQPHSIQGTWLASKSTGNMSELFLRFLLSTVETYKILLEQNQHPTQQRQLQEQAPPIRPTSSQQPSDRNLQWTQKLELVREDQWMANNQSEDKEDTVSQVEQEMRVHPSERQTGQGIGEGDQSASE